MPLVTKNKNINTLILADHYYVLDLEKELHSIASSVSAGGGYVHFNITEAINHLSSVPDDDYIWIALKTDSKSWVIIDNGLTMKNLRNMPALHGKLYSSDCSQALSDETDFNNSGGTYYVPYDWGNNGKVKYISARLYYSSNPSRYNDFIQNIIAESNDPHPNLYFGSSDFSGGNWNNISSYGEYDSLGNKVSRYHGAWNGVNQPITLNEGDIVTFSEIIKPITLSSSPTFYFGDYQYGGTGTGQILKASLDGNDIETTSTNNDAVNATINDFPNDNQEHRFSATIKITKGGVLAFRIEVGDSDTTLNVSSFKLEYGDVPTDWSESQNGGV